jgi:hypothetical protein
MIYKLITGTKIQTCRHLNRAKLPGATNLTIDENPGDCEREKRVLQT